MDNLKILIDTIIEAMKREFEIYGFKMSFWQIMLFIIIGSILIDWLVGLSD